MSQAGSLLNGSGAAVVETLTGDVGGAVGPTGGNINILGGNNITTTGNPGTSTITIDVTGTTDHAVQIGNATGSLTSLAVAMDGQLVIGSTGVDPVVASLTAGANITITPGPGSITIAAAGGTGFTWNEIIVVGPTAMAVQNGYIANNPAQVMLTLPAVAVVGDVVRITGKGAGGWRIAQNAGQTIYFGTSTTTTGVLGSLDSTADRDTVELLCVTANNDWNVLSSIGNITVV